VKSLRPAVVSSGRRFVFLLALLVVFSAAGYAYLGARPTTAPLDQRLSTPPDDVRLSAAETAFYAYVAPRLHALAGETRALADLGRQKSRNLLQLQAHGERATDLTGEITAYGDVHGVPTRFAGANTAFRAGAAQTVRGMAEARQGFVRFDWERVARATDLFVAGAAELDRATRDLDAAVGANDRTMVVTVVASPSA
jgi:hypothetical protein